VPRFEEIVQGLKERGFGFHIHSTRGLVNRLHLKGVEGYQGGEHHSDGQYEPLMLHKQIPQRAELAKSINLANFGALGRCDAAVAHIARAEGCGTERNYLIVSRHVVSLTS